MHLRPLDPQRDFLDNHAPAFVTKSGQGLVREFLLDGGQPLGSLPCPRLNLRVYSEVKPGTRHSSFALSASRPNAVCKLRTANSRYFSSMTTEILISEVEII